MDPSPCNNGDMPQEVVFVLLPKFSMIALYGALEPLRLANRFAGLSSPGALCRWTAEPVPPATRFRCR